MPDLKELGFFFINFLKVYSMLFRFGSRIKGVIFNKTYGL